jgi:hypothetical protein
LGGTRKPAPVDIETVLLKSPAVLPGRNQRSIDRMLLLAVVQLVGRVARNVSRLRVARNKHPSRYESLYWQAPADVQDDDLGIEMAALERLRRGFSSFAHQALIHERSLAHLPDTVQRGRGLQQNRLL